MAQLWGGRFTKETDKLVYNFNASISFDKRFYEQDIRGSIAHVTMLAKQGILTEDEKKAPAVLHAKYGAWLAETKYHITDPEILSAIRWHTTGRPGMTLLEEIIFTADYIEPRRYEAPDLPLVRPLAFTDLKECIYQILKDTLDYLNGKGCYVDSMTNLAYDYYRQLHEEKKGN